jgi:hypothetical protein
MGDRLAGKGVSTLYMIGHDGIFHPIGTCGESLSYTPKSETDKFSKGSITFTCSIRISDKRVIQRCFGKRRKTTYKTIKRYSAKRNR